MRPKSWQKRLPPKHLSLCAWQKKRFCAPLSRRWKMAWPTSAVTLPCCLLPKIRKRGCGRLSKNARQRLRGSKLEAESRAWRRLRAPQSLPAQARGNARHLWESPHRQTWWPKAHRREFIRLPEIKGEPEMDEAVILSAVRTPIGNYAGALKDVRPDDLAALVIAEAVQRAGVPKEGIEDVIMGCANQAGEDNRNV